MNTLYTVTVVASFKYLIRAAAVLAGSCFCSSHAICSLCGVAVNVALNIQA